MIVYVVVTLFCGLVGEVEVFTKIEKAYEFIIKAKGVQGEDYVKSCKSGDNTDYRNNWEDSEEELHLYETTVIE